MNLTTDGWIPIIWNDGGQGIVSLREVFERGQQIQDLAVRPHERIALMRLLTCVAQAALDGPNDQDDWRICRSKLASAALDYLERWQAAFELLGDGPRFLQVANLEKPSPSGRDEDEGNSVSKLDLALATGHNPTLFDNAGGSERDFTGAQLATMMVVFQCFSPSGRIGVALWDGEATAGKGSSRHAPCLAGGILHALLRAENLAGTIHRNLMTKRQAEQFFGGNSWGKPVWELMPQRMTDAQAVRNARLTYLGRLVPLTRFVRLAEDRQSLMLANGLEYPTYDEGWREPSATVVTLIVKGQPKRAVLRASTEKAVWRELHALTVKAKGQDPGGPAALQNISEDEEAFDLWVGGLVASKAKLVDTTESVFHVPATMLAEPSQMVYEKGVRHAQAVEFRLLRAVSIYHQQLGDKLDRPEMKDRRRQVQRYAAAKFWTDIEQGVASLLKVAATPESLGLRDDWHRTAWGRVVWSGARKAYQRACPHGTPRQMRAYALGLNALSTELPIKRVAESEEEAEP